MIVIVACCCLTGLLPAQAISVKSFGVNGDGIHIDTRALNTLLSQVRNSKQAPRELYFPCGVYLVDSTLMAQNLSDVHLSGLGACSLIRPIAAFGNHANLLDLSGSRNLEIDHLTFDMGAVTDPQSHEGTVIFGGPTAPVNYGFISVHDNAIIHNNWQGIGIGTSQVASELTSLSIVNNVIDQSACRPELCGNGIDTGSVGTRRNVEIRGNGIFYPSPIVIQVAPGQGGDAIFCGHGFTSNFQIIDNLIHNAPGDGIQVYARPFGSNDPQNNIAAQHYLIRKNKIRNSGRHGIMIYGGTDITVSDNFIWNPGLDPQGNGAQGIAFSFGIHAQKGDAQKFPSEQITIAGNFIQDIQKVHTMQHGIDVESEDGLDPSATLSGNHVDGAIDGNTGYFHASKRRIRETSRDTKR